MRRFSFGLLLVVCFCVNCEKKNTIEPDQNDVTGTVTDIDGNVYQTIKIGTQWWMKEDLKVTHYRNGDTIPYITDQQVWRNLTTGAYCDHIDDAGWVDTYGHLYNWYAMTDSGHLAPAGWHVPTDGEWGTLINYLTPGPNQPPGGRMKEAGTSHWSSPNTGATNESGFTALPDDAGLDGQGRYACYCGLTEHDIPFVTLLVLSYDNVGCNMWDEEGGMNRSFSVRCVKD